MKKSCGTRVLHSWIAHTTGGRTVKHKGKRPKDRGQREKDRGKRTEDRGKRTEERGKRTEERGRRKEKGDAPTSPPFGLSSGPYTLPSSVLFPLSSVLFPLSSGIPGARTQLPVVHARVKRSNVRSAILLALAVLGVAGCGPGVETKYGRSRSVSVNGTGVFADLFRAEGDQVRPAVRLTDELREWADVIVRFAPAPGPPPREEAEWYNRWLNEFPERRLVYVTRDYEATEEYWARALDQLPANATARTRERIEEARKEAEDWPDHLPPATKKVADDWFTVKAGRSPTICSKLAGPWARGVNPKKAALTRHQALKAPERGRSPQGRRRAAGDRLDSPQ